MASEDTKEKTAIEIYLIVRKIINIFAEENLSIDEADKILRNTALQLRKQIVVKE